MNIQDPISDMIIRIKNGQLSKKSYIYFSKSKIKENICEIMKLEGFINNFYSKNNTLKIFLKYFNNYPVIEKIKRISKPGLRVYYNLNLINKIKLKIGIIIISTSRGLMTHKLAKKNKIGGEAICYIL